MNKIRTICKRFFEPKKSSITTNYKKNSVIENRESIKNKIKNIKYIQRKPIKQQLVSYRPFRVSVEGNISAGKTNVIEYLSNFPKVETYTEPINWWRNLNGHNLLDLLYKDINKWYVVFQKYVLLTRIQIQTLPPKFSSTTTQIFERSLQNNQHTFVEQALTAGYLKPPDFVILERWFQWVAENIDVEIDFIVYLRTTPEVVYERMKIRGRLEESEISLTYLQQLHEAHEKWLLGNDSKINKNNLLIIDADKSLDLVLKQCEENKNKIIRNKMVRKRPEFII